ncbi:MAG TPA: hypothetical protein P5556_02045 [Candidatus Gastranaerophilales bacterium]|nr:hypothetical protein [Candidatus Gastranaerophilales bacterium]
MDRETLKQKINFEIHLRNTRWTALFLVIAGTISLVFRFDEGLWEKIFFTIGFILIFLFLNGCVKQEDKIENLIKDFERSK